MPTLINVNMSRPHLVMRRIALVILYVASMSHGASLSVTSFYGAYVNPKEYAHPCRPYLDMAFGYDISLFDYRRGS